MSLADIRTAIVDTLKASGLGDHVKAHSGRLTAGDLKRIVVRGNASLRVGCLGAYPVTDAPAGTELKTRWVVYILTMDSQGLSRDDAALGLIGPICQRIAGNVWGRVDLDVPREIRADNLYSGSLDKRAVALWAVTWRQEWTPVPFDLSTLDDFLRVHADWDINQDGEADFTDEIDLAQE